jgi:hypothetical protein
MTWQENVSDSFIRGIGKTSGTILVIGLLTGLLYLSENRLLTKKKKKTTENETQTNGKADDDAVLHSDDWRFRKMFERFA